MNKLRLLFSVSLFFLLYLPAPAQNVSNTQFKAYKDSVNTAFRKLAEKVRDSDSALIKAESVYSKAEKHVGLAEQTDGHFRDMAELFLAFFGGIIAYFFYQTKDSLKANLQNYHESLKIEYAKIFEVEQKKLRVEIAKRFDKEVEIIDAALGQMKGILNIKTVTKILIISKKDDTYNEPLKHLNNSGFKNIKVMTINDDFKVINSSIKNFDLFIIDNENGADYHWDLTQESIKDSLLAFLTNVKKTNKKLIYFGNRRDIEGGLIQNPVFKDGNYAASCNYLNKIEGAILDLYK